MKSYEDMLHLPHPVSKRHPQMPIPDRAAQFAPFAALTGYEDSLTETARLTDRRMLHDEGHADLLNRQLIQLREAAACAAAAFEPSPQIIVTYFCPDTKKEGGAYRTVSGMFLKVDIRAQLLWITITNETDFERSEAQNNEPGTRLDIPLADIFCIEGDCFRDISLP